VNEEIYIQGGGGKRQIADKITYSLFPGHFSALELKLFFTCEEAYERAGFHVTQVPHGKPCDVIVHLTTQKEMTRVMKLKPNKYYHGVESLNIEFVDSYITNDPRSDIQTINQIYTSLLEKENAVLLHSVTKKRKNHLSLMNYISGLFPTFTFIIYNGDGIRVLCKKRGDYLFAKPKVPQFAIQQFLNKHIHIAFQNPLFL
jgi:hypothetical protein